MTHQHVLITGGGSGVGAAIAHRFATAGHSVTILGRDADKLRAQNLPFETCDVTDTAQMQQAVERASDARGPITTAIANAGAAESVPFHRMQASDLHAMLDVNLIGVFNTWSTVLPAMKTAGRGRLIAVASTAGLKGYAYVSGYCAAKHGVVGMTRALALELATTGITVNAICPGFVETPMLERSIANIRDKTGMTEAEARASLMQGNPQRRFVQSDEVADAALWLASEGAVSVNGHALSLSGGEI